MKRAPIFTIGITACSVMLLVACSGAPNAGPTLPASQMSRVASPQGFTLAGNDMRFFSGPQSRLMKNLRAMPAKRKVEKDFFVSTTGPDVLIYSNKTYGETGELTNGLSATDGKAISTSPMSRPTSSNLRRAARHRSALIPVRPIRSTLRPTRKATSTSWTS